MSRFFLTDRTSPSPRLKLCHTLFNSPSLAHFLISFFTGRAYLALSNCITCSVIYFSFYNFFFFRSPASTTMWRSSGHSSTPTDYYQYFYCSMSTVISSTRNGSIRCGLITRSHSILSLGIEPGFIPYHNIALIGTLFSEYYIIPSCFAILVQD
jgi:hypothetical protein